jgi:hypothetical protein
MKTNRMWAGAAVAVCILVSAPVWSHPHPDQPNRVPNLEEVLDGLERGMVALEQLHRDRELDMLRRVADEVRSEMRGNRGERTRRPDNDDRRRREDQRETRVERRRPDGNIGNRIEVMRLALPALLEADRRDAAELLERAIHAMEMDAQRRRDDEAAMIRRNAPSIGQQIELLQMASGLWREFGHDKRAVMVGELAEQLAAQGRDGRRPGRQQEDSRRGLRDEDRRRLEEIQEQFERLRHAVQDLQRRLDGGRERDR